MAPPPPPEIMDDVIGEILLRLPPGDPACLVRASLVCKSWRRLLSDGAFLQQYRAFHRTPPVLGFFHDLPRKGASAPQYVPTTHASPVPQLGIPVAGSSPTTKRCTIDCRHGRVLFQDEDLCHASQMLTVWNPITGDQQRISPPVNPYADFCAAVLCAVDGCDHLGCSEGPFLVVTVDIYDAEDDDDDDGDGDGEGGLKARASLYSSETGVWNASTSINVDSFSGGSAGLPSLLARDAIYFILEDDERRILLKYSLVGGVLSVMSAPPLHVEQNMIFAAAQDGELGATTVEGYSLHLWLWRTDCNGGVGEWTRSRVIELDVMIPMSIGDPSTAFELAGFAEGTGTVFISANDDIFTVQLKSGKVTKMGKRASYVNPIFPFVCFYNADLVRARLQVPTKTD